jgi:transglutaminase 1
MRRGNEFEFVVQFGRHLTTDEMRRDVVMEFHMGDRARTSRGTLFHGVCHSVQYRYEWKMDVVSVNDSSDEIRYKVHIPVDAPVGGYKGYVRVRSSGRRTYDNVWEIGRVIVILFNPWNKDDEVYMADDGEREEYVMNESGFIWGGAHDSSFARPWNYAQFEPVTLSALLYLMNMWNITSNDRRSPIHVSRCLTNMVNSNDSDGGILIGKWSANAKDYEDGTEPNAWIGSQMIMQQYMESNGRPVKYGQCWVFGGLLTTVLRCVGIPARPVTNFESAHDTDSNRAIDYYFDKDNNFIDELSSDSIWNYHVWVEGWMSRADLGPSFGGWQVLDSTPQELSPYSRTMVVGPASVQAIKDGIDLKYDNEFVISEVNADVTYHMETEEGGDYRVVSMDTTRVGRRISTKGVGIGVGWKRIFITDHYKYKEGSTAERASLLGGSGQDEGGVKFNAKLVSRGVVGNDIVIEISVSHEDSLPDDIRMTAVYESIMYTGTKHKEIKRNTVKLSKDKDVDHFRLSERDYINHLGAQPHLGVTIFGYVPHPSQSWINHMTIRMLVPDLHIDIDNKGNDVKLSSGTTYPVVVSFTNPLSRSITGLSYIIEGSGLIAPLTMKSKNVPKRGTSSISFTITPRPLSRLNVLMLVVTAHSHQIKGMTGSAHINLI